MSLEKLTVLTELMTGKHNPQMSSNWNWPLRSLFFGCCCSQQVSWIWPRNNTIGQQPLSHSSRRGYTGYCQLSWRVATPKPHLQISKTKQLFPKTIKRQIICTVCGCHFRKSSSEHIPVRCNGLMRTLHLQRSTVCYSKVMVSDDMILKDYHILKNIMGLWWRHRNTTVFLLYI